MLADMAIQRMANLAIVDDLDAAATFFGELGMELEGKGRSKASGRTVPSDWTACEARSR
jgi:hypothetical protein